MDSNLNLPQQLNQSDHDLLIRLTVMSDLQMTEVREIRAAQSTNAAHVESRLRQIETQVALKADTTVVDKKADKSVVEQLERFRWTILGGSATISVLFGFIAPAIRKAMGL